MASVSKSTMARIRRRQHCETARADAIRTGRDVLVSEVAQRDARTARYQLRDVAQSITARERIHGCGRKRVSPNVALRLGSRGAGYAGVETCSSIWACAVCAAAIRAERAREIQDAVGRHVADGGGGLFITMTVPHGKRDKLRALLRTVTSGWGQIMRRKAGRDWKARLELLGYIRAVEVTYGEHGWHPHLHLLVLTRTPVPADFAAAFTSWLQAKWVAYASDRDWGRTGGKFGVNVQDVVSDDGLAKYVAKVQDANGVDRVLGAEVARADLKAGRGRGGRTPFEMLADISLLRAGVDGDDNRKARELEALWREYEAETAGYSALRWSPGLRAALEVEERTDEEIAAELDLGGDAETILELRPVEWLVLCRTRNRGRLLEVAERYGEAGARLFIAQLLDAELDDYLTVIAEAFPDPAPA